MIAANASCIFHTTFHFFSFTNDKTFIILFQIWNNQTYNDTEIKNTKFEAISNFFIEKKQTEILHPNIGNR